jgi:hypothetical protein
MPCGTGKTLVSQEFSREFRNVVFLHCAHQTKLERYDGIRLTAQQCWWTVTLTQRDGDARAFVQRARRGERVSSSATYASVDVLVELMCDIP